MSIDRNELFGIVRNAIWHNPRKDGGVEAVVDAVLAEVAKHNTPSYTLTSDTTPTHKDASDDGYVLAWRTGSKTWGAVSFESVKLTPLSHPAWMAMPPAPVSEDDAAFEHAFGDLNTERTYPAKFKTAAREFWNAALTHRDKAKP